MFDQSFSARNFRKIFDLENRKGVYLEGRFFPDVVRVTQQLKDNARHLRELHKNKKAELASGMYKEKRATLLSSRDELKETKNTLLTKALEQVANEVAEKSFRLDVTPGHVCKGKRVYSAGATAASYFAIKQVQYNIRRLYKVRQGNRNHIVCQLRELLRDTFPKYVLRTDLSGFYESIPRDTLNRTLAEDPLLTLTSRNIIQRILWEYGRVSAEPRGLPRGIGLSAYLSELYMRKFDERIRSISGVIYYSRYVDDIVLIFVPKPGEDVRALSLAIERTIAAFGLMQNPSKTSTCQVDNSRINSFDYLGYNFTFGRGSVDLALTDSKVVKYEKRLRLAFQDYKRTRGANEKRAGRDLVRRVKFLTGNTRLKNNKRHATVGAYFSNSHITSHVRLTELDLCLTDHIASVRDTRLRSKLGRFSFEQGYLRKRFHCFSTRELSEIVKVWKHVT